MNETYIQLYATHSKVYGPSTVIFLQVGKFYELYDLVDPQTGEGKTSMRRATELLNIQLSKKADGSLFAGVPEQSLHKYAQVLTREGWTVVVVDQIKNAAGEVTDRKASRILSPGTHVETATTDSLYIASLWLQATEDERPPSYALTFLDLTTCEAVSTEGQTVGRSDAWSCDAILHLFQLYAPKEVLYSWRGIDYLLPDEQVLRSRLGVKGVFHRRSAGTEDQGSLETPYGREEYLRSVTSFRSILPLRTLLGVPHDGSSLVERSLCSMMRFVEDHHQGGGVTGRCDGGPAAAAAHLLRHSMLHGAAAPAAGGGTVYLGNNVLEQVNMIPSYTSRTASGAAAQRSVLSLFEGRALTPMGKRSLRHRLLTPISSAATLEQRYEAISWFVRGGGGSAAIESALRGMYDLPRLHTALAKGSLTAAMVSQLEQSYHHATALAATLANQQTPFTQDSSLSSPITSYLAQFSSTFPPNKPPLPPVLGLSSPLSAAAGPRSAALESRAVALYAAWNTKYEAFLAWASLSAESLRLESRDEGLTLRASKGVLAAIEIRLKSQMVQNPIKEPNPPNIHKPPPFTQCSIQTRKSSSSSLECEELTRLREQLAALREEHARVQAEEIAEACVPLWISLHPFQTEWIAWITSIDESQALARAAVQLNLVRPTLMGPLDREEPCEEGAEGAAVEVNGLRHPLIEAMTTREAYVKHSVSLGFEPIRALLVYGVNASGKSSLMKALAISVLLAQAGSFVPADSMRLHPFRSLYSRIWNQDNLFTGHSSFAVEMSELRDILRHSNEYSLVLGDEVCAGTESQSATALVGAALEWLDTKRTCFLFATHLHDLLKVPGLLPRDSIEVCHLRVDIDRATGKLVYDRRLHPGPGSSLYGLEVARAMDIPLALIDRAHAIRRALAGEVAAEDAAPSQWNSALVRKSCEVCRATMTRDLEVHHIQPRAEGGGNALRNLIVVCSACHDAHHAGKIQIGPLKLTSDGMERSVASTTTTETSDSKEKKGSAGSRAKWSQEDLQIIHDTMRTYATFPIKRVVYEIGKRGIQISESSTRAIRTKGCLR